MLEALASQAQEYISQRYLAWGLAVVGLLATPSEFVGEGWDRRGRLCVALQHIRKTGERLVGRRGVLFARRQRPICVSHLMPLVLIVVTVETQQLPVAPVGRIVVVVVVLVRIPVKLNAGSGDREHGFRRT